MNKLTKPMRHLITNYNVGAVASVNENGLPAVSPKATFVIIDDKRIAFGNIRSPATVVNLRARPEVEINFVDVLTRRAVRIKGSAEIVDKDSEAGQQLLPVFEAAWAPYLKLMDSFVSHIHHRYRVDSVPGIRRWSHGGGAQTGQSREACQVGGGLRERVEMKMKRVLVTGGSGRLGSFVVRALIDSYQVTVLDLAKPTESCEFVIGSVLDRAVLTQALHGQDAVIHLAALDAAVSATDAEFMRVNVEGTWNLFECAHSAGIGKVVHYSSVAALNISRHNPPRYLPVDATHPADPQDGYGLSKLIGEKIARRCAVLGMQVICLRPALVMQSDITYDVARLAAEADGTSPLPKASHPGWRDLGESTSGSRSFVDPRDAANAFKAALEVDDIPFRHLSRCKRGELQRTPDSESCRA